MNPDVVKFGQTRCPGKDLTWGPSVLALIAVVAVSWPVRAYPQGGRRQAVDPDAVAAIETAEADLAERLSGEESAAKGREDAIRKEAAAAITAVRDEAERRMAADRNEWQAEMLRLHKALDEAAARAEERERSRPPTVGAALPGLSFYGYVQADYQMTQSSEDQLDSAGQPLNQDRFLIRRARLGALFERTYGEGRIEVDGNTVNGPTFRLLGAEASAKLPGPGEGAAPLLKATIGSFRVPFGQEVPQDDRDRLFMERSTAAQAFFPGQYDLGARLGGSWHFLRYVVAVMNGQPIGDSTFPELDPNHQKDVLGRLGVEQSAGQWDVAGGFSGLRGTGFHAGQAATQPTVQWVDSSETGVFTPGALTGIPGAAATPSSTFSRIGFGADLAFTLRWAPALTTSLAGELYLADNLDRGILPADPNGVLGRDLRELGYYVYLIQAYGRWRLGARYDYYNPDQDANKNGAKGLPVPTDASYSTLAVVAACVAPWGRLLVEFDRNRNHLGLNLAGMPADLANDAVVVRGEVSF
jgi:hypothetical protein